MGHLMALHAYDGAGVLLLAAGQRIEDEATARRLAAADVQVVRPGALLHDVGKMRVAAHILNKTAALSPAEFAEVRRHPRYGVEILSRSTDTVSETVSRAVFQHHERHDGAGYPDHLPGERISTVGQLVAVADTYDAMTTVRPYRRSILPKDALAWLYAQRGLKYDPEAVAAFIGAIGVYPVGSGVRLTSGEVAVVVSVNRQQPAQPQVMIVRDREGRKVPPTEIMDLAADGGRHIVSHVDLSALGISPAEYLAAPAH